MLTEDISIVYNVGSIAGSSIKSQLLFKPQRSANPEDQSMNFTRRVSFGLCVLLLAAAMPSRVAAAGAGTSIGQAIGNGVKGFLDAAFPGGSALLNTVQNFLTNKLNGNQQNQLKNNADTAKTAAKAQNPAPQVITDMQNAADTLKLTSIILYHTNRATAQVSAMLATLDATPQDAKFPFSLLNEGWNNVKGDLAAFKEDSTLKNARDAITDTSVSDALQGLDDATRGPVSTVSDNLKPEGGDRTILRSELKNILDATTKFNNLGVILLGATGKEITKSINNFKGAAGGSSLDSKSDEAVQQATDAVPKPVKH